MGAASARLDGEALLRSRMMSADAVLSALAARYDWLLVADPGRAVQPIHETVAQQIVGALHREGWSLVRGVEPGIYEADTSADGYYLDPLVESSETRSAT